MIARVFGPPKPQGSMSVSRGGRIYQDRDVIAWRNLITQITVTEARRIGWRLPLDEPVRVGLTFWLPRPKKPRWEVPAVKPDLDKLCRSVLDALSPHKGIGVLKDDSRVIALDPAPVKEYETADQPPGVLIVIRRAS